MCVSQKSRFVPHLSALRPQPSVLHPRPSRLLLSVMAAAQFEPSQAEMDAYMKKMGISRAANHHLGRPSSRGKVVDDDHHQGEEGEGSLRASRSYDHLRSSTQVRSPGP